VKKLGNNLNATAFSEDGIIEAVESIDDRFLVGVQWHPECLTTRYPDFLRLFESFIYASEKYKKSKV
jgi:putative glutamine amidotransferase